MRENEAKTNASIAPLTSSSIKLPKKQRIVYDTIMKNPGLRKPIICKISNLNNNSVNDAIRALSKKELVKYQGSSKDGGYFTK